MLNRVPGSDSRSPPASGTSTTSRRSSSRSRVEYAIAVAAGATGRADRAGSPSAGFASGYGWTKFTRAADEASASITDLRVELIGPERGEDFALVVAEAYELPADAAGPLAVTPQLDAQLLRRLRG